jgi:hypothetical protein
MTMRWLDWLIGERVTEEAAYRLESKRAGNIFLGREIRHGESDAPKVVRWLSGPDSSDARRVSRR